MYGTEGIFLLLPTGACMYVHARTLKSQVLRITGSYVYGAGGGWCVLCAVYTGRR